MSMALFVLLLAAGNKWELPLNTTNGLTAHNVAVSTVTHQGKRAVKLLWQPGTGYSYALLPGETLEDGTVEVDLAGLPAAGAGEGARGFVGLAFRVRSDGSAFECFYLRPTNGRADDQLRRNHSTQYISHPGFTWERLRRESPGVYESYVDLQPGVWTHMKIEFAGKRAALYVNGADQPALIVNDLKLAPAAGGLALWVGDGTEAYFRNLKVSKAR
jgi:hypothetical protein